MSTLALFAKSSPLVPRARCTARSAITVAVGFAASVVLVVCVPVRAVCASSTRPADISVGSEASRFLRVVKPLPPTPAVAVEVPQVIRPTTQNTRAASVWIDERVLIIERMAPQAEGLRLVDNGHRASSALSPHVAHVLGLRSKEEVRGIDTGWVIAVVANEEAIRDQTVVQFPRDSAGNDRSAIDSDLTVTVGVQAGRPQPARRAEHRMDRPVLVDLHPKAFSERFHDSNIAARTA